LVIVARQVSVDRPNHRTRKRITNRWHIDAATTSYENLLSLIRADGQRIESYEIPFVRDDRVSGSTLARRLLGLPAIAA
jgi:hypothetical protein